MVQTSLRGLDATTFLTSELHKAATLQKLTMIGEAAARLPASTPPHEGHPLARLDPSAVGLDELDEPLVGLGFRDVALDALFAHI